MVFLLAILGVFSAAQAPATTSDTPSFEVASVKPSPPGTRPSLNVSPGGRFTASGMPLRALIQFAYHLEPKMLSGGESWMNSERFNVIAKPPDGAIPGAVGHQIEISGPRGPITSFTALDNDSASSRKLRQMLQNLLAERFQLKLHPETKEMPVYALVVAKNGPKLEESKSPDHAGLRFGGGQISFQDAPMEMVVAMLTRLTDRDVVDRTGLKGSYDFTLQWTPDRSQFGGFRPGGGNAAPPEPSGPSIFTAIQEQLGLKLEGTKAPVTVYTIDHAEHPSAD